MAQRRRSRGRLPVFFWIILALLALALAFRLVRPGSAHAQHPEPRPGIAAGALSSTAATATTASP